MTSRAASSRFAEVGSRFAELFCPCRRGWKTHLRCGWLTCRSCRLYRWTEASS